MSDAGRLLRCSRVGGLMGVRRCWRRWTRAGRDLIPRIAATRYVMSDIQSFAQALPRPFYDLLIRESTSLQGEEVSGD